MAISVINEPDEFSPIYHSSTYKIDSTNKSETKFKYVFRLIVETVEVRNIKVSPEPITGNGRVDLSTHLKDFVDHDLFDITAIGFQEAPRVDYILKVDESYTDGSGSFITNVDAHVFSLKTAYNSIFTRNELLGGLGTYPKLSPISIGTMLINMKPLTTIYSDDLFFFHITGKMGVGVGTLDRVLKQFDISGNLLSATVGLLTGVGKSSQFFTLDLGSTPINPSTYSIEASAGVLGGTSIARTPRLILKERPCSRYTPVKLIYLDAKGSYNSLNFDGVSNSRTKSRNKTFRKFVDPLTETEVSRGVQRFFQESSDTMTINSLFVEEESNIMFKDFVSSSRVFIDLRKNPEFDNVDFLPIEVLTKNFNPINPDNGKIPQYKFQIRFAFEEINR